ncbi:MAG: hypothetical protein UHT63_01980 [Acutalibacteraceae bacterium]|nr:hypothetical protein [Acutalibacteraceae bacterium]
MNDLTNKLPPVIRKNLRYIVIILGVMLILVIFFTPSGDDTKQVVETSVTADEYAQLLENNIADTVKSIVGGKPTVMVTLKSGTEYVYANEEKSDSDEDESESRVKDSVEKKVVILDENGKEVPLTVTEIMPKVKGIVIVCNGGNDSSVQTLIRNTISVALGVESDCVCVTGTLLK